MADQKKLNNILWQAKMQLKKNWLEAMRILKSGLKEYPNDIELLNSIAEIYFSRRLFRKAIGTYQEILRIEPDNNNAVFQLANSFLAIHEFKLAIDYYERLVPSFPELLYNKAYAYSKLGRKDKSIEVLENIFSFKVTSILPYIFLAELYFLESRHIDAIKTLEKAQKKFGKQGSISYLMGLAYFNLNNFLRSYVEFEQAEKLKVKSANFYKNYALSCHKIGKTEKAIELLMMGIKLNPFDPVVYIELIQLYMEHERYEEAFSIAQLSNKNVPYSVTLTMLYDKILRFIDERDRKDNS